MHGFLITWDRSISQELFGIEPEPGWRDGSQRMLIVSSGPGAPGMERS